MLAGNTDLTVNFLCKRSSMSEEYTEGIAEAEKHHGRSWYQANVGDEVQTRSRRLGRDSIYAAILALTSQDV
jgi:hypothetical protein